jgi:carboxylesterase
LNRFSLIFRPQGERRGSFVLFHGLTGVPLEMEELAETLAGEGYEVRLPCLGGHGTRVEELGKIPSSQWLDEAFTAVQSAKFGSEPIFVGGISFGAVLALHCAAKFKLSGLVLLAPSLQLRKPLLELFMRALSTLPDPFFNWLWISRKSPRKRENYRRPRLSYDFHAVGSVARLVKLRRAVLKHAKAIRCPVLIIQDPADHYLSPKGAEHLIEVLDDVGSDLIWIPGGEHDLSVGPKYEQVRDTIFAFLERVSAGA